MVQINFAQKQVSAKIVYYGPGMSGKTTNLEVVHQRAPAPNRGDLTSISTDGDRTLFFDYMPLDLGQVAGMRTSFQVYTVPGQVYYNSTRKLVLQGVDGVIFVADSAADKMEENLESLRNLEENLNEYGKSLATLPHVVQFNKRDLPNALPVDELSASLNTHGAPIFEAVANTGEGVFPTLKALAACVLRNIMQEKLSEPAAGQAQPAVQRAPAAAPQPPAPVRQPQAQQPVAAAPEPAPRVEVNAGPAPPAQPRTPSYASPPPVTTPAYGQGAETAAPSPELRVSGASAPASQGPTGATGPGASTAMPGAASPSPGGLMGARPTAGGAPAGRPRPASRPTSRAVSRATTKAPAPAKKSSLVLTGTFVAVAATLGALLAKFVLEVI
jgi:signal recognition particle receptor subunit beta